jgi:spore coat protein F
MKNITDKEIVNVLLSQHKLNATSLTTLVLESANENLRNDVTNILNNTFKHQKQIFDVMSQKGWYPVQNATQQQISQAQQEVRQTQQSLTM